MAKTSKLARNAQRKELVARYATKRAALKASQELKRGAWMVSLEFEAQGLVPTAVGQASENRPIWLYQQPFQWVHQQNKPA